MNKISNKNRIINVIYSLGVLAILTFGTLVMPLQVYGQEGGFNYVYGNFNMPYNYGSNYNYSGYNSYNSIGAYYSDNVTAPVNSYTPTIYSDSTNPNPATSANTAPKTVAKAKVAPVKNPDSAGSLAANAIFGSNSFMPSGLIQWILLAILVLLIIILVRKVSGGDKKYQETPMKHA